MTNNTIHFIVNRYEITLPSFCKKGTLHYQHKCHKNITFKLNFAELKFYLATFIPQIASPFQSISQLTLFYLYL